MCNQNTNSHTELGVASYIRICILVISKRHRVSKYGKYYCMNLYLDGTRAYVVVAYSSLLMLRGKLLILYKNCR